VLAAAGSVDSGAQREFSTDRKSECQVPGRDLHDEAGTSWTEHDEKLLFQSTPITRLLIMSCFRLSLILIGLYVIGTINEPPDWWLRMQLNPTLLQYPNLQDSIRIWAWIAVIVLCFAAAILKDLTRVREFVEERFLSGRKTKGFGKRIKRLRKAAERGNPSAQECFGRCYLNGRLEFVGHSRQPSSAMRLHKTPLVRCTKRTQTREAMFDAPPGTKRQPSKATKMPSINSVGFTQPAKASRRIMRRPRLGIAWRRSRAVPIRNSPSATRIFGAKACPRLR